MLGFRSGARGVRAVSVITAVAFSSFAGGCGRSAPEPPPAPVERTPSQVLDDVRRGVTPPEVATVEAAIRLTLTPAEFEYLGAVDWLHLDARAAAKDPVLLKALLAVRSNTAHPAAPVPGVARYAAQAAASSCTAAIDAEAAAITRAQSDLASAGLQSAPAPGARAGAARYNVVAFLIGVTLLVWLVHTQVVPWLTELRSCQDSPEQWVCAGAGTPAPAPVVGSPRGGGFLASGEARATSAATCALCAGELLRDGNVCCEDGTQGKACCEGSAAGNTCRAADMMCDTDGGISYDCPGGTTCPAPGQIAGPGCISGSKVVPPIAWCQNGCYLVPLPPSPPPGPIGPGVP
jgi:hypothetical protein